MQPTKSGDRVLVHYLKRFNDGAERSSRSGGGEPMEVTVGTPHPRLPGLGTNLVGMVPGEDVTVGVPAGVAYRKTDPTRVRRLARSRFPEGFVPAAGRWTRVADRQGRMRTVRVVSVRGDVVVVDLNHPRAGQGLELSVELIAILAPASQPVAN